MVSETKPVLENMPLPVQKAVGDLLSVIAEGVARNPKLAMEEKMANALEGAGFKAAANIAHTGQEQVAAISNEDMSRGPSGQGRGA